MSVIEHARWFAIKAHSAQLHGHSSYEDHLASVANKVADYTPEPDVISAAWLHDTVEDTDVTVRTISDAFGPRVGHLVDLLTDRPGKNRMERHLDTYYRIRKDRDAILIKLADRLDNHRKSVENHEGSTHWKMYHKEYLYFKFALYEPRMYDGLWLELDNQYQIMKSMKGNDDD